MTERIIYRTSQSFEPGEVIPYPEGFHEIVDFIGQILIDDDPLDPLPDEVTIIVDHPYKEQR